MEFLRVTAELASAVCLRSGCNLDGLLMHAIAGDIAPSEIARLPPVAIPLARAESAGQPVYLASDAEPDLSMVRAGTGMTQRRDGRDVEILRKRFNRSGGPGRDQMKPVPLLVSYRLSWVAWGDRAAVHALLASRIRSVGALRAHGYGRVRSWRVDARPSVGPVSVLMADGLTRRAVPMAWCESASCSPISLACSPPYWLAHRQVLAVPPGYVAVLTGEAMEAIARC